MKLISRLAVGKPGMSEQVCLALASLIPWTDWKRREKGKRHYADWNSYQGSLWHKQSSAFCFRVRSWLHSDFVGSSRSEWSSHNNICFVLFSDAHRAVFSAGKMQALKQLSLYEGHLNYFCPSHEAAHPFVPVAFLVRRWAERLS